VCFPKLSELKVSASLVMDFEQVGDDIIPVSLSTETQSKKLEYSNSVPSVVKKQKVAVELFARKGSQPKMKPFVDEEAKSKIHNMST